MRSWHLHENGKGFYGNFGGIFVPETLIAPLNKLEIIFKRATGDRGFMDELKNLLNNYAGRPTPLTMAKRLEALLGIRSILLKREDLAHTGAHKINNCLGQALLAKKMGMKRIIAETGAGQHGVATATVSALLGLKCTVYMGGIDMKRQSLNVFRMKQLGAEVREVSAGSATLKDAINEALRDWAGTLRNSYYLLGSALGPHPYPLIVKTFQSVIGREAKRQFYKMFRCPPDAIVACVGGGSNAIGIFSAFEKSNVRLIGVEAGGTSIKPGRHAARVAGGSPGVLHGCYTYILQDKNGQILPTHSISAGLDYPAIGPEHANLFEKGRAEYYHVSDKEAIKAVGVLCKTEGILPALESAHAVAWVIKNSSHLKNLRIIINLSGRGDKDLNTIMNYK